MCTRVCRGCASSQHSTEGVRPKSGVRAMELRGVGIEGACPSASALNGGERGSPSARVNKRVVSHIPHGLSCHGA